MKLCFGPFFVALMLGLSAAESMPATDRMTEAIHPVRGWYLLAPPFAPGDPPGPLQLQAPLNCWTEMDSTATAESCEEQRDNMLRMYRRADITSTAIQFQLLLYHYTVCVSSADRRLHRTGLRYRLAQSGARPQNRNRNASAFAGPPIEHNSDLAREPSIRSRSARRADAPVSVPLMLCGLAVIATVGSICGWWLDPGRIRRSGSQVKVDSVRTLNVGRTLRPGDAAW